MSGEKMDTAKHSRSLLDTSDDEFNNSESANETSVNVIGTPASTSGRYSDHGGIENDGMNTTTNDEFEDDEEVLIKRPHIVPHDRFSFTYMAFYLLGMTTLLPWNFFITAEPYWMYKFRNVTSNSTTVITPTQATFISDLSFSASIPSTTFLILNAFIGHKIRLGIRMNGSLIVVFVIFLMNTALIKVDTDQWQDTFFYITIASVVVMNIATAIMTGGLFGICGQFPSEYMTAVVSGQALGGVFTAIAEIVTITFSTDDRKSTFIFFIIGNVLCVLSVITYIILPRTNHFKYYTVDKCRIGQSRNDQRGSDVIAQMEPSFKTVMNKIWMYGFAEWLVFAVTLSVYPAVTVLVNSESHGNGHPWNDIYFIPVTNYLIFNSGDYLGRILAGMLEWPNNKPHIVAVMTILRMAFLPALLLCNTNPRHRLPVFIHSDYIFILLMCAFAFTNGYFANLAMICAPKAVTNREKEMASSTMAAFLGLGLAFGSTISLMIVQLI